MEKKGCVDQIFELKVKICLEEIYCFKCFYSLEKQNFKNWKYTSRKRTKQKPPGRKYTQK